MFIVFDQICFSKYGLFCQAVLKADKSVHLSHMKLSDLQKSIATTAPQNASKEHEFNNVCL